MRDGRSGAPLRLLSGFGCFLCGSLAVLLCAAAVADPAIKEPPVQPEPNVSPLEASDECVLSEQCIDQYLWSVYERARKVDTVKVEEQIETTVKNQENCYEVRG
jgi:hypothetical protein